MGFTDTRVSALLSFLPVFYLVISRCCIATDTITSSRSITDGETLISAGGIMELGFFSPGNSSNRYVGMWYKKIPIRKVVWVLNRMNPLNDFSGVLAIGNDGNLILLDEKENAIWSTKASSLSNNSVAVLQDSGNLVLKENSSDGRILWQSFDYPSDTLLETMKIGMNFKTGEKRNLTSWKSKDDPSPGIFALVGDDRKPPQFFVMNGSVPYWRTGQWNGRSFIGVPEMSINYLIGVNLIMDEEEGTLYLTFSLPDSYTAVVNLQSSGNIMEASWNEDTKERAEGLALITPCDIYGTCGPFGSCSKLESPICSCMRGFEPRFPEEWRQGNWTGGCVRKTQLQCEENSTSHGEGKADKFMEMGGLKLPDFADYLVVKDVRECQDRCLKNCSCLAYAYISGPGCMVWGVKLIDVQKFPVGGEQLYLRLASSEIGERKQTPRSVIILIIIFGLVSLGALGYILYRCKANQSGKREKVRPLFDLASKAEPSRDSPLANIFIHGMKQEQSTELPLFDFSTIITATDNFSVTNKLGEGGYGPVYKGKLLNEQEIAVKRLSKSSGQGIEEFKNEVVLISRLQHRNLVKLLGCCIEGEEKMLLYEYMPNKSLDMFLFDPSKQAQLDWAKRFNIIEGIARGLLYLHRDSRLRVIHRDLKVSNILLDKDMNPKISDFGMARIFGGEQSVANTKKVAGTFGYMSPEYALGGIFSEKSDVFSFGVLLLEIVAGKRNTSFHHQEKSLNLLGYAWRLWNEGKGLELMDGALVNSCSPLEVMRCIHVGLLCVQENATDRPTMPAVVLMLGCETNRQHPKQPGFTLECSLESDLPPDNDKCSINNVTVTKVQGR